MKNFFLSLITLMLTATYTPAEEKCDQGKCSNATKQGIRSKVGKEDTAKQLSDKYESEKMKKSKNIPKNISSQCGQGKCGQ